MALFKDTEDIAEAFPFLQSVDWPMLLPFVELVEQEKFRDEILGPALYDALHAAYQASIADSPTPLSGAMAALYAKVRRPLAFLTALEQSDTTNVLHTSGGMAVTETTELKPAHMGRIKAAQASMTKQGYGYLNQLINHLLANVDTLTDWTSAPLYEEIHASLVPTMKEVRPYLKLAGPWLLHHLRPSMRVCQEGPVKKLLGDTAYDALLTAVQGNTTSADQKAQLAHIRPAILYSAVSTELVSLAITIDSDGVTNWKSVSSGSTVSGGKQPADKDMLNAQSRSYAVRADAHLEELRKLVTPATSNPTVDNSGNNAIYFGG